MQIIPTTLRPLVLAATLSIAGCYTTVAQTNAAQKAVSIDTAIFSDATNHWYGIADRETMVHPVSQQPRYKATELEAIADNILLYQKDNGGWPKNYDMQAMLTPKQKDTLRQHRGETNTTFDNRTTYSHIAALCKVYTITKNDKYKNAALKGLDFILAAQYPNGGWPQYYPLQNNYSRHITFNDDTYSGIMLLLRSIAEGKPDYTFIDAKRKAQLQQAYQKGLDCILAAQINDNGTPTAWCQQHNETTLAPDWARKFEPPAICNGESVDVVQLLMSIQHPSPAVKNAIQHAVAWFNASKITGIRIQTINAPEMPTPYRVSRTDKVVVNDPNAPPVWTRYYELKTHKPLFCNRDSKVVYSLAEVDRERRDGYAWYTYAPQKILNQYAAWQKKWDPERNVLANYR
jgi:PelA/Pel-15E family pectate lyase